MLKQDLVKCCNVLSVIRFPDRPCVALLIFDYSVILFPRYVIVSNGSAMCHINFISVYDCEIMIMLKNVCFIELMWDYFIIKAQEPTATF